MAVEKGDAGAVAWWNPHVGPSTYHYFNACVPGGYHPLSSPCSPNCIHVHFLHHRIEISVPSKSPTQHGHTALVRWSDQRRWTRRRVRQFPNNKVYRSSPTKIRSAADLSGSSTDAAGWRGGRRWEVRGIVQLLVVFCLVASLVFYTVPFRAFVLGWGFYYLCHPRFRGDMPSVPFNFFRRLPSLSDQIL